MEETLFREIIRYIGFGERDQEALRQLYPLARPHFPRIADTFYVRILEHPPAAAVLDGPDQVERLKVSLQAWLDRLLAGPWDEEYYELRARIGRRHVRVNLPQRYMFTAMSVIRQQLLEVAREHFGADRTRLRAISDALSRVVDLELAIMLESYREDSLAQVKRIERVDRELLEQRLEMSEDRYDAVVENAEALIVLLDHDSRALLFNRQAEEVTGYRRWEIIGRPCMSVLTHEDDREMAQAAVELALAGEKPQPFDGRIKTHAGSERCIRWHMAPLPATSGTQACAIGIDVTEQLQLAGRTRRAERLAALGTLAAGLAHEIRNPLNAAQLQLEVLERRLRRVDADLGESGVTRASALVREELRRLTDMVQDFLAFARPTELRLAAADVVETARSVVSLVRPSVTKLGIKLHFDPGPALPARFDDERIKQVLLNLLRNACDAAGKGGEVWLSVRRSNDSALIEVRDSGDGVPEDVDIFEPFRSTKPEGTGLGLPIVHRIVSEHGGDVHVSRRDERTVFTVELPIEGPPHRSAT